MLAIIKKILLGLLVLIGCGLWCAKTQQEYWYDLYNYHFYNGWAFVTGKGVKNFFVSGMYSYFAPLLDSLTYLKIKYFNPFPEFIFFLTGFFHGIIYILSFFILKLFFQTKTKTDKFLFFCLLIYSVSGFALIMQLGTTSNEVEVSCLFLLALYLFFKNLKQKKSSFLNTFATGFIITCGLGLKLTLFPMCIGFGACVIFLIFTRQLPNPFKTCLYLAFGGIVGFSLIDGWWLYLTWKQTGNPVFPMANHIFQSPLLPAEVFRDDRFLPKTFIQTLFYPFYWITGKEYVTDMYVPIYIFHAFIPYICILFLLYSLFRCSKRPPCEQALIIFYIFSYIGWMGLFSILRYAIVLEILSGVIILLCFRNKKKKKTVAFCILAVAILSVRLYPKLNIRRSDQYLPVHQITVSDDTLVITAEDLSAFVVPFIKTNQPVLGFTASTITNPMPWDQKTKQKYQNILYGKKIIVISNILKINDLLENSAKLNIQAHIYQFPNDTPIRYYLMAAPKKTETDVLEGFYLAPEFLDEFIDLMTAKNAGERFPQ